MLFNSNVFLFEFLPGVIAGFFILKNLFGGRAAQAWLAVASVLFYGSAGLSLLPPLAISIAVNFVVGRALSRRFARGLPVKALLLAGIAFDLLLLGWFKYAGFAAANLNALGFRMSVPDVVLPLGISFYTFTQIAFLADAARGAAKEYDILRYVLFVTFFPHLIAGPIIHHREMMPQFEPSRLTVPVLDHMPKALTLFAIGLFKKVLVADGFANVAQPVFATAAAGAGPDLISAWGASLAYAFQIYFDFSGYSDMALGLALMFGIRLPMNFLSPYKSTSIIEFWRSWHMTLSRFLRDYVYFPLGGNRHGAVRRYANLMTVMMVGGLWHGAGWTFLLWGALHGLYLLVNHAWRAVTGTGRVRSLSPWQGRLLTFAAVVLAWVLFRADSFAAARVIYAGMFGFNGIALAPDILDLLHLPDGFTLAGIHFSRLGFTATGQPQLIGYCALGLILVWALPNSMELTGFAPAPQSAPLKRLEFRLTPGFAVAAAFILFAGISAINSGAVSQFIYYRF